MRSHRGRKGDGWPRGPSIPPTRAQHLQIQARYPDVCPQARRCAHVVCQIVWHLVETAEGH